MRDCGAHHAPGITIKSSGWLLPLNASRIKPRSTTAGGKKAGEEVREEDEGKGEIQRLFRAERKADGVATDRWAAAVPCILARVL